MSKDVTETLHQLMMSPTFSKLAHFAENLRIDTHNRDQVMDVFSKSGLDLVNALDNDRIHFDCIEDKAMLLGLLTVTMDFAMEGRLKGCLRRFTLN